MNKIAPFTDADKNNVLSLIGRIQGIAELMQCASDDVKGHVVDSIGYTIEKLATEAWDLIDRPFPELES